MYHRCTAPLSSRTVSPRQRCPPWAPCWIDRWPTLSAFPMLSPWRRRGPRTLFLPELQLERTSQPITRTSTRGITRGTPEKKRVRFGCRLSFGCCCCCCCCRMIMSLFLPWLCPHVYTLLVVRCSHVYVLLVVRCSHVYALLVVRCSHVYVLFLRVIFNIMVTSHFFY